MSNNNRSKTVSLSAGHLTANSLWLLSNSSINGKKYKAATFDVPRRKSNSKNLNNSKNKNNSVRKFRNLVNDTMRDGIDKVFVNIPKELKTEKDSIKEISKTDNGNYFTSLIKNKSTRILGGSIKESKKKVRQSFLDYLSNHKILPPLNNHDGSPSIKFQEDDKENVDVSLQRPILSPPKSIYIRKAANSSPLRDTSPITQNILADAISPSLIGPTNIRFVTTNEREIRDRQVTQALNMISQSMEPPVHKMDKFRDWILKEFQPREEASVAEKWRYSIINYLMGVPFTMSRAFWHYVVLEIHLVYNLMLLYATFLQTPPIIYFVIGITLFWIKIIYELYRDIIHRDDPIYASEVPKELSLAAAISATMGFILNMKAQAGEINLAWWTGATR